MQRPGLNCYYHLSGTGTQEVTHEHKTNPDERSHLTTGRRSLPAADACRRGGQSLPLWERSCKDAGGYRRDACPLSRQ